MLVGLFQVFERNFKKDLCPLLDRVQLPVNFKQAKPPEERKKAVKTHISLQEAVEKEEGRLNNIPFIVPPKEGPSLSHCYAVLLIYKCVHSSLLISF